MGILLFHNWIILTRLFRIIIKHCIKLVIGFENKNILFSCWPCTLNSTLVLFHIYHLILHSSCVFITEVFCNKFVGQSNQFEIADSRARCCDDPSFYTDKNWKLRDLKTNCLLIGSSFLPMNLVPLEMVLLSLVPWSFKTYVRIPCGDDQSIWLSWTWIHLWTKPWFETFWWLWYDAQQVDDDAC